MLDDLSAVEIRAVWAMRRRMPSDGPHLVRIISRLINATVRVRRVRPSFHKIGMLLYRLNSTAETLPLACTVGAMISHMSRHLLWRTLHTYQASLSLYREPEIE